jgi:ribokinase
MSEAGVRWLGRESEATAVSVALPAHGDRAFVSVSPKPSVDLETLSALEARAIVVDLPSATLLPPHPRVYGVVGDPEVAALAGRLPSSLAGLRALILNEREVGRLTGESDVLQAARSLAVRGTTVVVTRGADGVAAIEPDGGVITVTAPTADIHDTTGAGDLLAAAYVWGDLAGLPIIERLELATRYASLSLERADGRQKGLGLEDFQALVPE